MSCSGPQCALVTRFIRNLRGGSQAILAEASDGNIYVVKFAHNLQGPNVLFNEAMGTELYRSCGLPVPAWSVLRVTDSFMDGNRECWLETGHALQRRPAGLCFGSRMVKGCGERIFEILPGGYFRRLETPADFWLAWLVDICANHSDVRQALFCEEASRRLRTVFIDFGHMFGGAKGDAHPHFRASRYTDERIYPEPAGDCLLTMWATLSKLNTDQLLSRLAGMPEEWRSPAAERAFAACLDRLSDARFVEKMFDAMVDSLRRTCEGPTCRDAQWLRPSILHPCLGATRKRRNAMA